MRKSQRPDEIDPTFECAYCLLGGDEEPEILDGHFAHPECVRRIEDHGDDPKRVRLEVAELRRARP